MNLFKSSQTFFEAVSNLSQMRKVKGVMKGVKGVKA